MFGDDPLPVLLTQHLPAAQIPQQIDNEERMAFGALVNHAGEAAGEGMIGELQREVPADRRFIQTSRHDFAAGAARDQVELQRQERVPCLREIRRTAGRDDEELHVVDAAREVSD